MVPKRYINKTWFHCGFFFTGVLVCGFFGTAGGIFGMLGGTGGWGGTGRETVRQEFQDGRHLVT